MSFSSNLKPHRPPPPPLPGDKPTDPSLMPAPAGKEKIWSIRAENDPTSYWYECNVENEVAAIRDFEAYKQKRVATINGRPRSHFIKQ